MTFEEFRQANEVFDRHDGSWYTWLGAYESLCREAAQFRHRGVQELSPHLFARATDEKNLFLAFKHIKEEGGPSVAPDGESCADYIDHEWEYARWLKKLLRGELEDEQYEHGKTRQVPDALPASAEYPHGAGKFMA